MRRLAATMSTFLYTLLGLTVGSSLHCAERREISPCSCRSEGSAVLVACERIASFAQVRDALHARFPADTNVALRIAHSSLHDLRDFTFLQLGFVIGTLKLNHDNISQLPESSFVGLGSIEYLSLADSVLPAVPQHVLRHMPHIRTLDLGRNHIQGLLDADFQDLHELQHLVVAGNQISYVERHSVPRTLRHLHLGRNQIQNLNDSLRELTQLEWLFVNSNKLTTLDGQLPPEGAKFALIHASNNKLQNLPNEFKNFLYLETLFVQNNEIQSLGGSLKKSRRLRILHLEQNKLHQLAEDEFQDLELLEELQLGNNQLHSLNNSLLPLRSLRFLNLTHNLFQEFSLREILGLRDLKVIDISNNHITHLRGQMTQNVVELETRVTELRLENNLLKSLDGSLMGLHGLQRLNLSNNRLEKIAPDDLIGLDDLRVLDISHNRLTTLEETSKTFLPSLESLFAANNLLTALERDFHGLPVLCWADLSHNQIQTIARELTAKTRCKIHNVLGTLRIFIQGNPIICNTGLEEAIAAMEANYSVMHGLLPCVPVNMTVPAVDVLE